MNDSPIFIVGTGRSGTTLLMRILNRHPGISILYEPHFLELVWRDPNRDDPARFDARRVLAGVRNLEAAGLRIDEVLAGFEATDGTARSLHETILVTHMRRQGKRRFGEKTPSNFCYLDLIRRWYPDARVLFLYRDPRSVHASYRRSRRFALKAVLDRVTLGRLLYWNYSIRVLEREAARRDSTTLPIRFETMIAEPERVISGVCDFIGEDYSPGMLDVDQVNSSDPALRSTRGIRPEVLDRARDLGPARTAFAELVCGEGMLRHDYRPSLVPAGLPRALCKARTYAAMSVAHRALRSARGLPGA